MADIVNKDRVKVLLGSGATQAQVAMMVGCTPGYISQLMADEDFSKQVAESVAIKQASYVEHDSNLDKLEDKVIKNLETSLTMCYKPEILLKALQVINKADRRSQGAVAMDASKSTATAKVVLPKTVIQKLVINNVGAVVKVGERELVTLDTGSFKQMAHEFSDNFTHQGVIYEDAEEVGHNGSSL